jgi:hypothetical protein
LAGKTLEIETDAANDVFVAAAHNGRSFFITPFAALL